MSVPDRFGEFVLAVERLEKFKHVSFLEVHKNGQSLLNERKELAEKLFLTAGGNLETLQSRQKPNFSVSTTPPSTNTEGVTKKKTRRSKRMTGRAWARKQSSKTNEENAPKLMTSSGKKNKSADRLSALPSSQADGKKEKSPCRGSGWRPVASVPDAPPSQEEYVETEVSGLHALPPRTFVGASENGRGEVRETEDPSSYTGRPTDQEDVNMHHPASGEMQLEMQSVGPSDFPPVIAPAGGHSQNEEVVPMLLGVLHSTLQTQEKPGRAERRTAKQQRKRERKKEAKHQAQLYAIRQTRTGDHQTTLGGSPQKVAVQTQGESVCVYTGLCRGSTV